MFYINRNDHQLEISGQGHSLYWRFKDTDSAIDAVNNIYKALDEQANCIKIGESGGLVL